MTNHDLIVLKVSCDEYLNWFSSANHSVILFLEEALSIISTYYFPLLIQIYWCSIGVLLVLEDIDLSGTSITNYNTKKSILDVGNHFIPQINS